MGCCISSEKNVESLPFEKLKELNKLKTEIAEIINDKNHKERKNINKLFELFNRTSNIVTDLEKELTKIQEEKIIDINNEDMIKGVNKDIKLLKEYNHSLNELIKESGDNEIINNNTYNINNFEKSSLNENEINNGMQNEENNNYIESQNENEIIDEEINLSNNDIRRLNNENNLKNINSKINNNIINDINDINDDDENKNNLGNDFQNRNKKGLENGLEIEKDFQKDINLNNNNNANEKEGIQNDLENYLNNNNNTSDNNNENDMNKDQNIYYRKSIRRNKIGTILNRRTNLPKVDFFGFQEMRYSTNTNENTNINNENVKLNEESNIINLIFVLENDNKYVVQAKKKEKLEKVIGKMIQNIQENKNLENILVFDGDCEITERVKNGENIFSFGFQSDHVIQLKFKN